MPLREGVLADLVVDDEASFRHIGVYQQLKKALARSGHRFAWPATGSELTWDRALLLNLTYWNPASAVDVLCDHHIAADVVAHAALHHVVGVGVARAAAIQAGRDPEAPHADGSAPPSALALLFGESIASAFDLYLVGRLVDHAPDSDFVTSQLPILAEVAEQAGLDADAFAALVSGVARDPERAFEDLRALLFDAATALLACRDASAALVALESLDGRRFAPLLHHYQLSNWILYARAYAAAPTPDLDAVVRDLDAHLRAAPDALGWIARHWIEGEAFVLGARVPS